jgi:hypothetical protein
MDDLFGQQDTPTDPSTSFPALDDFAAPVGAGDDHDFEANAAAFPDLDAAGDEGLDAFTSAPQSAIPTGNGAGGATGQVSVTGDNELSAFESEYPEIELPSDEVCPLQPTEAFPELTQLFSSTSLLPLLLPLIRNSRKQATASLLPLLPSVSTLPPFLPSLPPSLRLPHHSKANPTSSSAYFPSLSSGPPPSATIHETPSE